MSEFTQALYMISYLITGIIFYLCYSYYARYPRITFKEFVIKLTKGEIPKRIFYIIDAESDLFILIPFWLLFVSLFIVDVIIVNPLGYIKNLFLWYVRKLCKEKESTPKFKLLGLFGKLHELHDK